MPAQQVANGSTVPLPIPKGLYPLAFVRDTAIGSYTGNRLSKQVHPVITELTCERFRRFQHLGDMAGHLDLMPHASHHALLVDQKGASVDAHVFAAIHALFDPHPVALRHLAVSAGGAKKRQPMLLLQLVLPPYPPDRHS